MCMYYLFFFFKVILGRVENRKLSKHCKPAKISNQEQEPETVATRTVTPQAAQPFGWTRVLWGSRGRGEDMTVWLTW